MSSDTRWRGVVAMSALALVLSGCVSYQGQKARDAQVDDFMGRLAEKRMQVAVAPLALETSLALAMEANYDVLLTDLDIRMAKLGKNVTFAQFLPRVSATAVWEGWDKQPMMQDKSYSRTDVSIGLPLVMPSLWFMYAARGEQVAQAAARAHFVRQSIYLQTMKAYYDCLVADDAVEVAVQQVGTARETAKRIAGLAGEGLARDWESRQAAAQLAAREAELARASRHRLNVRGVLLSLIGLPPDYTPETLSFAGESALDLSTTNTVEALVLEALSSHPELEIADRNVVIRENDVRKAIADFLPSLSSFSTLSWSSDHHSWTANRSVGLSAAWDAFNGFANVGLYKLAKAQRTQSMLVREQTFLRIMLDVMVSRHAVDDARDGAEVLAKAYEAARLKHEDYRARQQEGLIPLSDALDAEATMNAAELELLRSRYQERIAWAALKLSMGVLDVPRRK